MNYWIFVHTGDNATQTFSRLIDNGDWGFDTKRPIRKKVESLRSGDVVLFYIGGPSGGYFSGEVLLTSDVHAPARASIGGPRKMTLDAMVDFDMVNLWGGKRIDIKDRYVRQKLDFIKNKDKWGMTFGQSIVKISQEDYNQIKSLL